MSDYLEEREEQKFISPHKTHEITYVKHTCLTCFIIAGIMSLLSIFCQCRLRTPCLTRLLVSRLSVGLLTWCDRNGTGNLPITFAQGGDREGQMLPSSYVSCYLARSFILIMSDVRESLLLIKGLSRSYIKNHISHPPPLYTAIFH